MALTSDIQPLEVLRAPATPATPTPSTKQPRRNTQTQSSLSRSSPVTRLENSPQSYDIISLVMIPAAATRLRNVPLDLLTSRDQSDRYIRNRPQV